MGTTLQLPHTSGLKHVWSRPTDHRRWHVIALLPSPDVEFYRSERIGSVSAAFISAPGSRVADTHKARAVKAGITGAKRKILPEIFSTRRTGWIMAHEPVKVRPHAIAPLDESRERGKLFPPVMPNWIRGRRLVAGVLTALGVSLATANAASGDDCKSVFATWVALSQRELQQQPEGGGRRPAACLANESMRSTLLKGLERARSACAPSTWLSAGDETTRSLIDINESFITSLPVCAVSAAEKGAGWVTEAAPVVPSVTEAAPVVPSVPEAAPVVPKRKAAAPPCLHISSSRAAELVLSNRRCQGETVLAVVETSDQAGRSECKAYSIRESFTLRTGQKGLPRINHECILNQRSCTKERISSMFPECEWAGR